MKSREHPRTESCCEMAVSKQVTGSVNVGMLVRLFFPYGFPNNTDCNS